MVIYISDDLQNIKHELVKRGYTVVSNGNNIPCDAVICNLKSSGLTLVGIQNGIKREGTLVIDIGNKTIDEIEYILNNRVYSTFL